MTLNKIEKYYNKFNEDKRLLSRHGQVEFTVTMKYIKDYLKNFKNPKILDIGAGTGRYSIELANEGYSVTAVELVKHNLNVLKSKTNKVECLLGNATNLKKIKDEQFDITLLLGPMYHLFSFEDKVKALLEAKRVTKKDGIIFVAYCMNDYAVITYAFKEQHLQECLQKGMLSTDYHCIETEQDLYSYVRVEDINKLNKFCNLKRIKLIAPDGPTDYIRPIINKMSQEDFNIFIDYQLKNCERQELIGASSHTLDIVKKC